MIALLAWGPDTGRLADLADDLGGEWLVVGFSGLTRRWQAPVRYVASVWPTIKWLRTRHPHALLVTTPPVFPGAIGLIYARLTGAKIALDAHPGSFGLRGVAWRLLLPLQRALVRHSDVTLVTEPGLAAVVASWGGQAVVLHEAPPRWSMSDDRTVRAADPRGRPLALFATTFERDEPTAAIATAAQLLPDVDILLPGDVKRLDRRLLAELRALPNVTLPGWLDRASYLTRLGHASVAVALTTDTHSVMRGACEAVWLGVPTVLTDNVLNREYFAPSTFTLHSGDAIAAAVRLALSCDADAAATDAADRKRKLAARWKRQRAELLRAIEPQHSL